MVIFHSYVSLPEGNKKHPDFTEENRFRNSQKLGLNLKKSEDLGSKNLWIWPGNFKQIIRASADITSQYIEMVTLVTVETL